MKLKFNDIGEPHTRRQVYIAKRTNLIALAFLFVLLGLVFYAFWELREKKKALVEQGQELEENSRRLELMAEELAVFREKEWKEAQAREDAWENVRQAVEEGDMEEVGEILGPVQDANPSPDRKKRKPDVAVFNTLSKQRYQRSLEAAVEKEGYPVVFHTEEGNPYSWLESLPTIFYFNPIHKKDAEVLKVLFDKITRFSFSIKEGDAKPMPKAGPNNRIEIHIVEPAPTSKSDD